MNYRMMKKYNYIALVLGLAFSAFMSQSAAQSVSTETNTAIDSSKTQFIENANQLFDSTQTKVLDSASAKIDSTVAKEKSKKEKPAKSPKPTNEEKLAKKEAKKFNKYIKKFDKNLEKSDDAYLRGSYGIAYGRSYFRLRKDVKKAPVNTLIAIDLAKKGQYLDGKGVYDESVMYFDSALVYLRNEVKRDTFYYKKALLEIAEAGNALGRSGDAFHLLRFFNDSIIKDLNKQAEGRMLAVLNELVEALDDTLIVAKKATEDPNIDSLVNNMEQSNDSISSNTQDSSLAASNDSATSVNNNIQLLPPAGIDPKNDSAEFYHFAYVLLESQKDLGYYQPADVLLKKYIRYQTRITNKKFKWKYPDGKKTHKEKIKRREFKRREERLASLYLYEAKLANDMGNYPLADSLFEVNKKKRIKKLAKKKSRLWLDNLVSWAYLKSDFEEYDKAAKYFEKARKKISRSNQVSNESRLYYAMKEGQILNYIALEEYKHFNKEAKKFIDVARTKYSRKSPQFITTQRVYNEGLYYKNPKAANRKLKRNYKKLEEQASELHFSKIPFNNLFFKIKRRNHELAEAKELLKQNSQIYERYYGKEAPAYHLAKLKMADFEVNYESDFNEADNLFNKSFDIAVTNQLHPFHNDYFQYLLLYAQLYELTDRFDKAADALIKALAIINKKFGKEDKYYGVGLERLAGIYIKKGNFKKAEGLLEKALDIIKDEEGKKSLAYVNTLRTLAELYSINGRFEDAEKLIKQANRLSRKLGSFVETADVSNSEELAELYITTGQYEDAEELLNKTIEIRTVKFGEGHYQLIKPHNLLGRLFLAKGDFVKAERASKVALDISEKALSDTSSQYLTNLQLLSEVYIFMGDYKKAEINLNKLLDQNKRLYGKDNIAVVDPKIKLAQVKLAREEDPQEIYNMLEGGKAIVASSLNDQHPLYATIIELQAKCLVRLKQFDQASVLLLAAKQIWENKFGRKDVNTANNVVARANLNYEKGDFDAAIDLYDDAIGLYKSIFSDQHPKYVKTQGKLARAYYAKKDYKRSLKIFEETTEQYVNYIRDYFPALSDDEKSKYWASIRGDFEVFNSLALNYANENPEILGTMLNNKLATKAILLSSSIKVKQRILNSGDEELISEYKEWIEKKEFLTKAISMSKDELSATGVNLANLQKEINELEKQLSQKSEAFNQDKEELVTWEDIQGVLDEKESVVEIIRFKYFDGHLTDSVLYAALIFDKQTKKSPTLVTLSNGNDLEGKFYKYYRNTIKYKSPDKYSYKNYWEPIDKRVPNNNKILISPDGIYNQINIETFQNDNGTYMIDKNIFYIVSNSKDIYLQRKEANDKELKKEQKKEGEEVEIFKPAVVLFGNPEFSEQGASAQGGSITPVDPLPGAEKEVEDVKEILDKNDWRTQMYLGESATESKVKKMENPKVFHIATHGFFIDDANEDEEGGELLASNNPLLKSGLLFTGANELLGEAQESIYNLNKKDGVLTAYEAMNLQLDNTELVVLSACETGLGEIKDGEGVYGLQRSFFVAGAKNVIMSLFKVNDQATQELMDTFYQKWVETGDKRSAFIYAKNKIREKYDAPIYWGSFIMLGLN